MQNIDLFTLSMHNAYDVSCIQYSIIHKVYRICLLLNATLKYLVPHCIYCASTHLFDMFNVNSNVWLGPMSCVSTAQMLRLLDD